MFDDRHFEELRKLLHIPEHELEPQVWVGNGGSGVVFKGIWRHEGSSLTVAIKKIKVTEEVALAICQELKIMQNRHCEHICKMYGGCLANNGEQVWLVMDYVEGGDLHDFLNRHRRSLPYSLQLSFCIQATQALVYLHTSPTIILHRDIKSLNFLVKNKTTLLLTDFGFAKAKALLTANSLTLGTIRWVAPEIVAANKPKWSEKADIFSLGMVFYEIVTKQFPYHEEPNLNVVIKNIKSGILPKLPSSCPKKLATIIQQCWSFKPSKRPSAPQLLEMLQAQPLSNLYMKGSSHMGSQPQLKETGPLHKSSSAPHMNQIYLKKSSSSPHIPFRSRSPSFTPPRQIKRCSSSFITRPHVAQNCSQTLSRDISSHSRSSLTPSSSSCATSPVTSPMSSPSSSFLVFPPYPPSPSTPVPITETRGSSRDKIAEILEKIKIYEKSLQSLEVQLLRETDRRLEQRTADENAMDLESYMELEKSYETVMDKIIECNATLAKLRKRKSTKKTSKESLNVGKSSKEDLHSFQAPRRKSFSSIIDNISAKFKRASLKLALHRPPSRKLSTEGLPVYYSTDVTTPPIPIPQHNNGNTINTLRVEGRTERRKSLIGFRKSSNPERVSTSHLGEWRKSWGRPTSIDKAKE